MTIFDMLGQSAILTVLGVSIVFGFLLIVVIVVSQFSWIFKSRKSKIEAAVTAAAPGPGTSPQVVAAISAAAIYAAAHEYRKSN